MMNQEIKNLITELRMESSINCQVDFREGRDSEGIYLTIREKVVLYAEWDILLKFFKERGYMFWGIDFKKKKVAFVKDKEKIQLV